MLEGIGQVFAGQIEILCCIIQLTNSILMFQLMNPFVQESSKVKIQWAQMPSQALYFPEIFQARYCPFPTRPTASLKALQGLTQPAKTITTHGITPSSKYIGSPSMQLEDWLTIASFDRQPCSAVSQPDFAMEWSQLGRNLKLHAPILEIFDHFIRAVNCGCQSLKKYWLQHDLITIRENGIIIEIFEGELTLGVAQVSRCRR